MGARARYDKALGRWVWDEVPDGDIRITNAGGNTERDVRRFIRDCGYQPTQERMEAVGREVRRSEAENRAVERRARERAAEQGAPALVDRKGDVVSRVRKAVKKRIAKGEGPPPRA